MAESRLDVVINPSRAQSGARAVKGAVDSMKTSWVEFTAKIFLAEQAVSRTWKAFSAGASFDESFARLNRQAGLFNQTADQLVGKLQRTTNGQLSMAEATEVASRAFAQGMNPDQINAFAQAAEALGDQMGGDTKQGFDELLQGLRSGRTQALADIGVYVDLEDEMKELALATGRTTDQISKQEKAAIAARAIVNQLPDALNRLGDGSISNADKMAAMEKKLEDIALKSKSAGAGLMFSYFSAMEGITAKTQAMFPILKEWGQKFDEAIGIPKLGLDKSLAGGLKEPPKPPDKKLLAIPIEGEHERTMKAFDAAEALAGEHFEQMLDQYRNYVTEQAKTALDLANKEKEIEVGKLKSHLDFLNARMTEEQRFHDATIGLADTTEAKISAEEKFKSKVTDLLTERQLIEEKISTAIFIHNHKIREMELLSEEEKGRRIVEGLISNYQIETDMRQRSQDEAVTYYANLKKFQDDYGTSRENQMTTEYDMVRANLAKQLDVTQETAAKVLNAWRNGDSIHAQELLEGTRKTWDEITTIMMGAMADQRQVSEKYSDDFFAGFAKSMKKYVDDTSVFGLGIDQARRVAQGMEQGFGKFFFDAMEGRIQSFKDVVQGLTDFAKNIISQLASQLVTQSILKGLTGAMGSFGGGGGNIPAGGYNAADLLGMPKMARGGVTSGPTIAGEAGPEAVIPLQGGRVPVQWASAPYGLPGQMMSTQVSVPVKVEVYNQTSGKSDVQTQSQRGSDGTQTIKIMIREAVKEGFARGDFRNEMASYGATLKPMRR